MEEQKGYGVNDSVSNFEMLQNIFGYCLVKLQENSHKSNPFNLTYDRIEERIIEEKEEFLEAYQVWIKDPTPENLEAMQNEIADIVNFYAMFSGKASGFTDLIRK